MTEPQDTFTITAVDNDVATVTFTFPGITTAPQKLGNMPVGDQVALTQAIDAYGQAYRVGLEQEKASKPSPSAGVMAMKGKGGELSVKRGTGK